MVSKKDANEAKVVELKPFLTMKEAPAYLGLSKSYVYKLTCGRLIPHSKRRLGGKIYFNREELNMWVLENRVKTVYEVQSIVDDNLAA